MNPTPNSISLFVQDVLDHFKELGYGKATIKTHTIVYGKLLCYAQLHHHNENCAEVSNSFLAKELDCLHPDTFLLLWQKKQYPSMFHETNYLPHSFRHSKAVHMTEAEMPIIYIHNFLGHARIKSTEIYARIGQAAVTKALANRKFPELAPDAELIVPEQNRLPAFRARTKKIM